MNLTEWCLFSVIVLLWLYTLSVKHSVTVLRGECSRYSNEAERERERLERVVDLKLCWSDLSEFSQRIRRRLDKLDPPQRRATDKKAPCHRGPTADGYVKLEEGCPHFNVKGSGDYDGCPCAAPKAGKKGGR